MSSGNVVRVLGRPVGITEVSARQSELDFTQGLDFIKAVHADMDNLNRVIDQAIFETDTEGELDRCPMSWLGAMLMDWAWALIMKKGPSSPWDDLANLHLSRSRLNGKDDSWVSLRTLAASVKETKKSKGKTAEQVLRDFFADTEPILCNHR
ncbi:hypothetical protein M426DRAFT_14809 [Hypoxylon sp. CI-4A]|nr:hypothetical protein M426DRAFT_14809 [Hypoxylon sp. CI-4A]